MTEDLDGIEREFHAVLRKIEDLTTEQTMDMARSLVIASISDLSPARKVASVAFFNSFLFGTVHDEIDRYFELFQLNSAIDAKHSVNLIKKIGQRTNEGITPDTEYLTCARVCLVNAAINGCSAVRREASLVLSKSYPVSSSTSLITLADDMGGFMAPTHATFSVRHTPQRPPAKPVKVARLS